MTPTTAGQREVPALLILKIGGGLFSVKSRDHDIDHDAVAGYARQVADLAAAAPGRVVLVSGGGSYGHGAVRHLDPEDPWAALPLTGANAELRWIWTTALRRAGALAFPVQLAAAAVLEEDGAVVGVGSLPRLLATGALPVLTGDCLLHPDGSLRVVGSDHVPAALLGLSAGPVRVAMLTDVEGVLDDGRTIPWIDPREAGPARDALRVAPEWDTTGAMAGKLDAVLACARRGAECLILRGDPDQPDLRHLLRPVSDWPAELRHTRIAGSEPTAGQQVDTVPA
ncbi:MULTISPECIES: amino acid kinase family protein [unclassified Streptomyces]|uniref:amino acid kinase family protein n=1 Tax=unclassified Streptomyces TaxID=2593676 RepID=UPI000DAC5073|nr:MULTISPECIES: hypothetical protein [unclassified Streptomyces]PZT77255.1 hypothetical protein DNK56_29035 [Streptomyces sp. AC1-42W]PZT78793.1 hypothetical protein DNK55_03645 [Streptomyces sp. AC1-42T]